MIKANNITMKFDLNRGKVKSLKERLFSKIDDNILEKKPFWMLAAAPAVLPILLFAMGH